MGRIVMVPYRDIVVTHPNYTDEELDKMLREEKEKSAKLTDWPKM